MNVLRLQAVVSGLWAGLLVAVGGVAAPSLFAALERQAAGTGAGQIFHVEARISLALAILMFVLERRRVRDLVESGQSTSAMSATLVMALGALFLTVFGGFVLSPLVQAAKAGQPSVLSFGALHGISAALFWAKALLVLVLAWRLSAR